MNETKRRGGLNRIALQMFWVMATWPWSLYWAVRFQRMQALDYQRGGFDGLRGLVMCMFACHVWRMLQDPFSAWIEWDNYGDVGCESDLNKIQEVLDLSAGLVSFSLR